MKSSNLAQRLEEFEASLESLNLSNAPVTRRLAVTEAAGETPAPRPRRTPRRLTLRISDQGLRPFRVR